MSEITSNKVLEISRNALMILFLLAVALGSASVFLHQQQGSQGLN